MKIKLKQTLTFENWGTFFSMLNKMSTQLATYIILFTPLYHASRTFKFINASPLQEHAHLY
jgi:hypothetical protein